MSKSKKNVIDPEFIIENYGADSVRLFILSDSPPEKDVQWSEQGMVSSYKFLQKLWILHNDIKNKISDERCEVFNKEFDEFINEMIAKISNNLEKFNYNVIIANMYQTYNFLSNFIKKNKNLKNLKENYEKILICFLPIIPHFINECLSDLSFNKTKEWPQYDKSFLEKQNISFVIQINGKKRGLLNVKKDINENELLEMIKIDKTMSKYFNVSDIKRVIFVKNRLINILLNG